MCARTTAVPVSVCVRARARVCVSSTRQLYARVGVCMRACVCACVCVCDACERDAHETRDGRRRRRRRIHFGRVVWWRRCGGRGKRVRKEKSGKKKNPNQQVTVWRAQHTHTAHTTIIIITIIIIIIIIGHSVLSPTHRVRGRT
ncbi:unnamed protein product [Aphis gossypii]|uniref:Uncharacterized protein n=1 Tax=Aphis gossypii TaxID=80765 RepID=A0A9P0NQX7_APHGO|nr:unnamed protein product [Aphis gossypii]